MEQPKINFNGLKCRIKEIEWTKNGEVRKIVFYDGDCSHSIFKNEKTEKIEQHPHFDYYYAPNLNDLIVS